MLKDRDNFLESAPVYPKELEDLPIGLYFTSFADLLSFTVTFSKKGKIRTLSLFLI